MLNIVCQLPIIFIFYLQLQSVNPFGLGDSPGVFNEKLKTFLSGLDKVCGIFCGVINGLFNRSRCKDNSKLTRKKTCFYETRESVQLVLHVQKEKKKRATEIVDQTFFFA